MENQGNSQVLAQREQLILAAFTGKRKTVSEAASELGIPYQTLIRYTRKLIKGGYLVEVGFRDNNKRYLTAIKSISDGIAKFDPAVRIHMHGEVLTITDAVTKYFPNNEVPIRSDLLVGLAALMARAEQRSSGTDNPGGSSPTDIMYVFKRIQAKLGLYFEFIQALLDTPIWTDDKNNGDRIGITIQGSAQAISDFERRYMAEDKGPLER